MEAGAYAMEEDKNGNTPMHIAAKFGHGEIIGQLSRAGANLRQVNTEMNICHFQDDQEPFYIPT